jgi:hypothetical protein
MPLLWFGDDERRRCVNVWCRGWGNGQRGRTTGGQGYVVGGRQPYVASPYQSHKYPYY